MVKHKRNNRGCNSENVIRSNVVEENDMEMIKMIENVSMFLLSAMSGCVTSSFSSRGKLRTKTRFDFIDSMGNTNYKVILYHIPQHSQFRNLFYLIRNNANEEYLDIEDMSNISAVYEIYTYKDIDNTYEIKIKYGDKLINDSVIPIMLERLKKNENIYKDKTNTLDEILKEHNDNLKQLKNKKKKLNNDIKKIIVEMNEIKGYINEIQDKIERV